MPSFVPYSLVSFALLLAELATIARILLRPHRDPASRIAWLLVVTFLPLAGILAYLLFGEVNIGRRRVERMRTVLAGLRKDFSAEDLSAETFPAEGAATEASTASAQAVVLERHENLFRLGHSISGFHPVGGNTAQLLPDSNATIDALVDDIDAAKQHVHLLFYIWLPDNNGRKVIEALKRAAARGVACRAMADDLGSRTLIRSDHWESMRQAGVQVANGLPIGYPLLRLFIGRIDLRNHRKIVVIDDHITYCGSQNCADPEFLVKAKFAPWVDAMMRFEGPIARQNQVLFAGDWMSRVDEDLAALLEAPLRAPEPGGFTAQAIGAGPTVRFSAMPEMFESMLYAARREAIVSTPYFVPNESLQSALCATAYRGVDTTLLFPARNDSWTVAAASRSYYAELLAAGVKIHEYVGGLLHAKSMTIDGEITLIGSANMDRRSFDLNYENNILLHDPALTAQMRARQQEYIARSRPATREEVAAWPVSRRLWHNSVATLGPLL
ncbi:cardiolipin synthase [uncultured Rhodoblastus sp.]|uniref:cardiolipin synthase n=1 Tax=uncultured Rhodoblastus sp. TaxID=543037 RepID=UPI0025F7B101|nr:cardiolipin synthase [uncultured Rhodoblastus sp.]